MTTYEPRPPQHLSLPIVDAVIFHSEEDVEQAQAFKEQLEEKFKDAGCSPILRLYDDIASQGRELQTAEAVCAMSAQHWFYVTDRWVDDEMMLLHKDENIIKSLKESNSFIPIWSKKKDEFAKLPYGVAAFTGLYAEDPRIVSKLKRFMIDSEDHQSKRQELEKQQKDKREKWIEEKKEEIKLNEKHAKEEHERKMEDLRKKFREAHPDDPVPSTRKELVMKVENQQARNPRKTTARRVSDLSSPEGAIPPYLLNSLDSARSSLSHAATHVYNITINHPQNVTIAASANNGNVAPSVGIRGRTSPTTLKNIAVNADNPNMPLNLTENDQPPSRPIQETNLSRQESSRNVSREPGSFPSRESLTRFGQNFGVQEEAGSGSGSSYEVVPDSVSN